MPISGISLASCSTAVLAAADRGASCHLRRRPTSDPEPHRVNSPKAHYYTMHGRIYAVVAQSRIRRLTRLPFQAYSQYSLRCAKGIDNLHSCVIRGFSTAFFRYVISFKQPFRECLSFRRSTRQAHMGSALAMGDALTDRVHDRFLPFLKTASCFHFIFENCTEK
ncbi:hypothetical protein K438DRAFT_1797207 [Mycena galopus ATCC 62051]|nr:hypothetical protein K438DRAFT_1797207 [Mycena galopus ATCC 62051]